MLPRQTVGPALADLSDDKLAVPLAAATGTPAWGPVLPPAVADNFGAAAAMPQTPAASAKAQVLMTMRRCMAGLRIDSVAS